VRANDLQKTYELYSQQDYAGALKRYRQMVDFQGRLGEGASHYRMGNYDKAAHSFINAVLIAENDTDRATALFNLGNSYFQIGDYAKASSVFGDVLRYKPGHEAGAFNQSFSRSLQIAVEQRIQRKASRSGSGPRSAEAPQGLTVGENSSLSISEEKEQEKQSLPLPNLPQEKLERLIARGLEQVQFAAGGNKKRKRFERQERELALVDARLRMNDQQDNQDALWKRLFEMEEGFPAPLEQPKPIPGVKPW